VSLRVYLRDSCRVSPRVISIYKSTNQIVICNIYI
jgi:hypothetical protein